MNINKIESSQSNQPNNLPETTELSISQSPKIDSLTTPTEPSEEGNSIIPADIKTITLVEQNDTKTVPSEIVPKTSEERAFKRAENNLKTSLNKINEIIGKITDVDSKINSLNLIIENLKSKTSSTSTQEVQTTTQINQHEKQISSLSEKKEALILELKDHQKNIEQDQKLLQSSLSNMSPKLKVKKGLKDAALFLLKTAKESSHAVEMIEGVLDLNKAGHIFVEVQEVRKEIALKQSLLEELKALEERSLEKKGVQIIHSSSSNLATLMSHLETQKSEETLPIKKAVIQEEIKRVRSKIDTIDSSSRKTITSHAEKTSQLDQKKAQLELEIKELEQKSKGLQQEVTGCYKSALAKCGYNGLHMLYANTNKMARWGDKVNVALTVLQVTEGIVSTTTPLIDGLQTVVPFLAIPFGALEASKGAYEAYEVYKHYHHLDSVKELTSEFNAKAEELKVKLDNKYGPTENIHLEILRLQESIKIDERSDQKLDQIKDRLIDEIKENLIEENTDLQVPLNMPEIPHETILKTYESSQESKEISGQKKELSDSVSSKKTTIKEYKTLAVLREKAKVLGRFIKFQKRELCKEFAMNSLEAAAGVVTLTSGIVGTVVLAGVFSAPAFPVFSLASLSVSIAESAVKGAYSSANSLYEMRKHNRGQFEHSETGIMYTLGQFIKEESSYAEKPITDTVLKYLEVKNPKTFVASVEKEMISLSKSHPKAASFQQAKTDLIFHP